MQEFSPETQAAFKELFEAVERQYGPIESFHMCTSFEGSPEWKRMMEENTPEDLTVYCEITNCSNVSVNFCYECGRAICREHTHPSISDDERDILVCSTCLYG